MNKYVNLFKALSDETRLRLVVSLAHGEHCVCELTEMLKLSQPKVSRHLAKLKTLGIVQSRRETQFIYYSLASNREDVISIVNVIEKRTVNDIDSTKGRG